MCPQEYADLEKCVCVGGGGGWAIYYIGRSQFCRLRSKILTCSLSGFYLGLTCWDGNFTITVNCICNVSPPPPPPPPHSLMYVLYESMQASIQDSHCGVVVTKYHDVRRCMHTCICVGYTARRVWGVLYAPPCRENLSL